MSGPLEWNELHYGYIVGDPHLDLSFDPRDDAAVVPKGRVTDPSFDWGNDKTLRIPRSHSVIYELNVRGYTMLHPSVGERLRGTMAGLRHPDVIRHLVDLGVTAVELLPVHPVATTKALARNGLREFWGYNSINFFALEPRYLANGDRDDFRRTVQALHEAGIEVILDVVFNHTGEIDEMGPTLSFRGIDNASYYLLKDDKRRYRDTTGCGNTLNIGHPRVLQMVMDSLRYFVSEMHVDGFRFDLAVSLARPQQEFSPEASFFACIQQDPVLAGAKLIAEPWDLGPDGYRHGGFPPRWSEWNDRFRDDVRRFWRGDEGRLGDLAFRLSGSSDVYGHGRRRPTASLNFITAHDGFTLEDLVSYNIKHNQANKENNVDGSDANFSWNCGVEGPTDTSGIVKLRERQKKNFMTTLLLSLGIPMIVAGDEFGRTQRGNNNAYCQDNPIGWVDWSILDQNRVMSCASAGPASEPADISVARIRTTSPGESHGLARRRLRTTEQRRHLVFQIFKPGLRRGRRRLAAGGGADRRRLRRHRRRADPRLGGFGGRPAQCCFQPLRHLGQILIRRRIDGRRDGWRRRRSGAFGRTKRWLGLGLPRHAGHQGLVRCFARSRCARHHGIVTRGDPRGHRLAAQFRPGLRTACKRLQTAAQRLRTAAAKRLRRQTRQQRIAASAARRSAGAGRRSSSAKRGGPAAAAARAFAARGGQSRRSAPRRHRSGCRHGAAARSGAAAARRRRLAAAQSDRARWWRGRYWLPRRHRWVRRSSADARHCRAGSAPGAGGHPRRRRQSRPDAASGRNSAARRCGCRRNGAPARTRARSAPERPRRQR